MLDYIYSSLLARRCLRYALGNISFCLFQVFGCMKMQIDAERNETVSGQPMSVQKTRRGSRVTFSIPTKEGP